MQYGIVIHILWWLLTEQSSGKGPWGRAIWALMRSYLLLANDLLGQDLKYSVSQTIINNISIMVQYNNARFWDTLRRWAGKTSYVHLAPEYEYRYKRLIKAYKNHFKTCSMALNTFKGFCWLSCGPATYMKLILFRSSFLFDSKFMFRGQMHIWGFFCPATIFWNLLSQFVQSEKLKQYTYTIPVWLTSLSTS